MNLSMGRKKDLWLWLLPLLSGILLWLAAPGEFGCWFVATVAFVPLLFFLEKNVTRGVSVKVFFLGGGLYGLFFSFLMLYWIIGVLEVYGGLPLAVSVLVLLLLASYLACYPILFLVLGRYFLSCSSPVLLLLLPSLWTGLEWLRSWLFTGFPWMDLGCYIAFQPCFLQGAEIFGHEGITWLLFFCNVALWLVLSGRCSTLFAVGVAGFVVVYGCFSYALLLKERSFTDVYVRPGVVQGNISQNMKWDTNNQKKTVSKYIAYSQKLLTNQPDTDFLVWPETALPFYPQVNSLIKGIVAFIRKEELPLITGTPWFEIVNKSGREANYYNAALLLKPGGVNPLGGVSVKSHLVPFGEYVPLQGVLSFLKPLVESAGNLTAGKVFSVLSFTSISGNTVYAGTLICYESIFPKLSRRWVDAGANILVNLTNDAWYGKSSAPICTLAMTVLRAVETRRSIVRAANTGFSAFILPTGEILGKTELFTPAAIAADLPLRTEKTFYVCYGFVFAPFCFFVSLLSLLLLRKGGAGCSV